MNLFHDVTLMHFYIFFITGIFGGCVDSIAGGGGLISLPVLLNMGMPPMVAFGTNKLQSAVGEIAAAHHFYRKGALDFKRILPGIMVVVFSASAGAILVQYIHPLILNKLIPFLLLAVLIYMIFSPRPAAEDIHPRLSPLVFYGIFGGLLGFYNGFFGPGTGSFWVISLMFFLGLNIRSANVYSKPLNTAGNLVSVVWFIKTGMIAYAIALTCGLGQICGARLGAHLAMTKGARLIKPVFIAVVSFMIFTLFLDNYFLH